LPVSLRDDPILARFSTAVREAYGDRLERIVLFGSRARGDHRPDSDYDIAVFIRGDWELWDEIQTLCDISTDVLNETGADISAKPLAAGSYRARTIFMHELRKDGRDL
jgi:uncharacterized protein